MSEGDTIHRLAGRVRSLAGTAPERIWLPGERRPQGGPDVLRGRELTAVRARGKHLLMDFDGGMSIHSHLGMRGRWDLYRPGERWRAPARAAWLALAFPASELVNFRGTTLRIGVTKELERRPPLAALGPDVLDPGFDPAAAAPRLRDRDPAGPIAEALLDQTAVAGIGNVFKSEACHEAGLDPRTPVGALTDPELASLLTVARDQMRASLAGAPRPNRVYRRTGEPCRRCGGRVKSALVGDDARGTYWCPSCQPGHQAGLSPAKAG